MVVGIYKAVALLEVENLIYLSCKNKPVATHDNLVIGYRGGDVVEV